MVFELVSHLVGAHGASMGIHGNMGAVGTHGTHGLNLVGSGNQVHDRYTTLRHPCEMRGNGGADAPVTSSGAQTLLVSQVGSIVALSACFGIGPLMQTAQKLCQKARACGAVAPHQRPVGFAIITHRKSPCCSITGPAGTQGAEGQSAWSHDYSNAAGSVIAHNLAEQPHSPFPAIVWTSSSSGD